MFEKTPVEEWHFKLRCRSSTCILTWNVTLPQVFFKHFISKKQLPGFYISRTLVEKGLKKEHVLRRFRSKDSVHDWHLLVKINNGNTRATCEIDLKLILKIPERRHSASIYLLRFNNRNTRKRGEICSKSMEVTTCLRLLWCLYW